MSATYDPTLKSDLDWVRFFIGDRTSDPATAKLQDEEIKGLLAEEPNKYLAAARAGETILALGRGVVTKSVDDLSISYGDSPESAYRSHLQKLREEGCRLLLLQSGPAFLRIL